MGRKTNYAVKLSLEAADYLKNLARVQTVTAGAVRGLSRGFKLFTAAFVSTAAVRGVARMTGETMGAIVELDRLSQSMGLTARQAQVFRKASEFAGDSEMDLGKALQAANRQRYEAIQGNKDLIRTFGKLGLSVEDLTQMTTGDSFEQIVRSLSAMGDETERNTIAFKIFGREAENMGSLLLDAGRALDEASSEIDATGAALDRIDLAAVRITSKALGDLGDAWTIFKQKLVTGLTPVIYTIAKFVESKLMDPAFVEAASRALAEFITKVFVFAKTLPVQFGVAWRTVAIEFLKVRRLFEGGFTGLENSYTKGIDAQVATLTEELAKLKVELAEGADVSNLEFFEKLQDALKDIGSVSKSSVSKISPELERLKQDLEGVKLSIQDGLTDTLAEFITTGKNGFRELGQAILKDLVSALLRAHVVMPLLNMVGLGSGSAGGGLLAKVFGGFRAGGGDVQPGRSYVVGEKRPELFVPRTAGRIEPDARKALGGRGGDTFVIDARGADSGAIARLENMILALHGSIERRSVTAVQRAAARGAI